MPKELRQEGDKGPPPCSVCGHTQPWHSMVCPRVGGEYCLECEAVLPRHYPWCSIGKQYQFFFWSTPRDLQKELETYFNQHMKNRIAVQAASPPQVEPLRGPEQYVMPEDGRARIKAILAGLSNHAQITKVVDG